VATRHPETGAVTVFAVNRHQTEPVALTLNVRTVGCSTVVDHVYLGADDLELSNSLEARERVVPTRGAGAQLDGNTLEVALAPISWTMLRLL
jgi:alpha-N-arabinofuranosidase